MAESLLTIDDLSVEFATPRGKVKALRRVDLSVEAGRIVGIVGESGCGKSTLVSTVMGLLAGNAEVSSGSIVFEGQELRDLDEDEWRQIRGRRLAMVTLLGPSLSTIITVIVVASIPVYGRIVRIQTLSLKETEFVLAERALGAGPIRILFSHILPNVIGPLLILASMEIPVVITIEAGLSFLGLGVRPPTPTWGSILQDGYQYIRDTPWLVVSGGLPLILTTLGFTFLGESLRDAFDPKLNRH